MFHGSMNNRHRVDTLYDPAAPFGFIDAGQSGRGLANSAATERDNRSIANSAASDGAPGRERGLTCMH